MKVADVKTRFLFALLFTAASGATALAQTPASTCVAEKPNEGRYKTVKVEPRLGEAISGYPKWKRVMLMTSGASSRKAYEVRYGGIHYTVGTERDSDVVKWVSTSDPAFRTAEGLAAGDTLAKVLAIAGKEVSREPGWGFHVELPSDWSAAFVQGPSMTDGELQPSAKICFFFKREH